MEDTDSAGFPAFLESSKLRTENSFMTSIQISRRNLRTRAIQKTSLKMLIGDFSVRPVFQVDRYHLDFVLSYHRSGEKGKGSADLKERVSVMKFADQSGRGGGTEKSKGLCLGKCLAIWPTLSCVFV